MRQAWVWIVLSALAVTYVPFLGSRYIRTGGDEKVYVNQALEMARDGRWFVQTIHDQPAYFKGPVHYLLVRLGDWGFGKTPWAILYMNFLFTCLGALALGALTRRRLPEWEEGPIWTGVFFGIGVGVYSHSFASQMEVELAGTFALALLLLDRIEKKDAGFWFWIVAGAAGWIKAPLHSAFLGISALLYWAFDGQFVAKAKNPKAWAAALLGVGVGLLGYLPPLVLDFENFWNLYIIKEVYRKTSTHQSVWTPIASTFGFYLFPWLFLAMVAYAQVLFQAPKLFKLPRNRSLLALVLSFCLPSFLFFLLHPYRFENYNLPQISAWILLISAVWYQRSPRWDRFYSASFGLLALVFAGFAGFVVAVAVRFAPLPTWWPAWLVPWVVLTLGLAVFVLVKFGVFERGRRVKFLVFGPVAAYLGIGALFAVLGEREMVDLRQYLAAVERNGKPVSLVYYNLMGNVWSEWGLLNYWIDQPVRAVHTEESLLLAVRSGATVLVPTNWRANEFEKYVDDELKDMEFNVIPWKRWRTRGGADRGKALWGVAWDKRDFSVLERDYFIIEPVKIAYPALTPDADCSFSSFCRSVPMTSEAQW